MLLKQKDSAYSRSVQAVSHSLSKPKWMGRTGKTGVKPDLQSANAFFDRVWTFSLTRCWKQRTTSCSTSQASSKQTSCMEDVVLTYETLSGSNVRNSARKSVRILISVCLCKNCTTRQRNKSRPCCLSTIWVKRQNPPEWAGGRTCRSSSTWPRSYSSRTHSVPARCGRARTSRAMRR